MKATLIGLVVLVLVIAGGFIGYTVMTKNAGGNGTTSPGRMSSVTKAGTVQKAVPPGDDYTHLLMETTGSTKLNSQRVSLSDYEGMSVTVKGAFSGNTLYVDEVTSDER